MIPHDFIARKQNEYFTKRKQDLKQDEYIVVCDFSENYSFIVQVSVLNYNLHFFFLITNFFLFSFLLKDAAQGWHWANAQCTIHPFCIYYKDENDDLKHKSLVIIAESLKHNFESVYLFQRKLLQFLKDTFSTNIQKISFFSDGSGGQYKNKKNFYELCQYKQNHGFDTEWHFFATSHGKGPCDAIGGAFKRNAMRASIQRKFNNHITTAKELYTWATENDSSITFKLCTNQDYKGVERSLRKKFEKIKQIPGTRSYHSFIPIGENKIAARRFSISEKCITFKLI